MSLDNRRQIVDYGFSQALQQIGPLPVIAKRAPTSTDFAALGTLWVNKSSNAAYVLTSISFNLANWESISGAAGSFSSLVVTPGPVSLTGTTTINTSGSATTSIGVGGTGAVNIGNATGNTTIAAGNLVATSGNISATSGSLSAGSTVTAGTSMTATLGNITATNGNVVLSTAATFVQLPGPVKIMSGDGAPGAGLATEVGDIYINTTAASLTTRIYIATAASTWTNIVCAA